jgi:hypothetical protein
MPSDADGAATGMPGMGAEAYDFEPLMPDREP